MLQNIFNITARFAAPDWTFSPPPPPQELIFLVGTLTKGCCERV